MRLPPAPPFLPNARSLPGNPARTPSNPHYLADEPPLAPSCFHSAGYKVLTTCSPSNNDLTTTLGASLTFDHSSPTCAADIRTATNNSLRYAWDTISIPSSMRICADALTSHPDPQSPARYGCLLKPDGFPRADVAITYTLAYKAFGEGFKGWGKVFEEAELGADWEFAVQWAGVFEGLLEEEGRVRAHPVEVVEGGFGGVLGGLDRLRGGKVSGRKLVCKVA